MFVHPRGQMALQFNQFRAWLMGAAIIHILKIVHIVRQCITLSESFIIFITTDRNEKKTINFFFLQKVTIFIIILIKKLFFIVFNQIQLDSIIFIEP